MSETALSNDDLQKAPDAPEQTPAAPAKRAGNGLVVFALLLGAAGVAVGGWGVWQVRQLQGAHLVQNDQLQGLRAESQALQAREAQMASRLDGLPPAAELEDRRRLVAQLQGDQQRLNQRLETVLGASRKDWRLAEAEHLLRLASLRLSALQDISSARALVEGADQILREQSDPASFAAREQLARSIAALNSVDQPDRTGLFLQLAALREQVVQLNELVPEFNNDGEPLFGLSGDPESRWSQWWAQISRYFRIDFNADKNVKPLLAGQSLNQVRLALSLTLEQAQWAALNGEAKVYVQALDEARSVLLASFNRDNEQGRKMLERLDTLASQPVTVVTPDLAESLGAVQAYLERRHLPAEEANLRQPAAQSRQETSP